MIACLVGYAAGMVYAGKKDRKDKIEWDFMHTPNNQKWHTHKYKVSLYTGTKGSSLKGCQVKMTLIGDAGQTWPRLLEDGKRTIFKKGKLTNLLVSCLGSLGTLTALEISVQPEDPDKPPKGKWHLDRITVADCVEAKRYFFKCEKVVDLGESSELSNKTHLAMKSDVKNFWYLLNAHSKKSIYDDHTWLSVFKRPTSSHFSRKQRWSCCVSAMFLSMISNAMWFGQEEEAPSVGLDIGPISLKWHTFYTAAMSALLVMPVNMAVITVFQKVKRKIDMNKDAEQSEIQPKGRKCQLPRWMLAPAWIAIGASMGGSAFFCFLYSMEWGKDLSEEWLIALVLGTVQSILCFQMIKVLVLALFFAIIMRMPDDPVDIDDETEQVWAPDEDTAKQDEMSALDMKMYNALRSILLSGFYVMLLAVIVGCSMDPGQSYLQNQLTLKGIAPKNNKLTDAPKLWEWMASNVAPYKLNSASSSIADARNTISAVKLAPYNPTMYRRKRAVNFSQDVTKNHRTKRNMDAIPPTLEVTNDDMILLGAVRIKQSRHPRVPCDVPSVMDHLIFHCHKDGGFFDEDIQSYDAYWRPLTSDNSTYLQEYFSYEPASASLSVPVMGKFFYFSGGGYILDLPRDANQAVQIIADLEEHAWLNHNTKGITVDIILYNANINMFTAVKFIAEFHLTGGIHFSHVIRTFNLYAYTGAIGIFLLIVQAIWFIILAYFITKEIIAMKRQRCQYFKVLWHWVHLSHLILAVSSVAMFFGRIPFITDAIEHVHNAKGEHVNFDLLVAWDEAYTIVIAFVLFLATFEVLKFFTFSKLLSQFIGTIKISIPPLLNFMVVFVIGFFGYACFGYLYFCSNYETFRSIVTTTVTLMSTMLGKMSKDVVSFKNSVIGAIFFLTYVLVVIFVLLNIFVSIINDAYERIKDDPELSPYDEALSNHMRMRFAEIKAKLWGKSDTNEDIEKEQKKTYQRMPIQPDEHKLASRLDSLNDGLERHREMNWDRFLAGTLHIMKKQLQVDKKSFAGEGKEQVR